jgi:hypothetical protein
VITLTEDTSPWSDETSFYGSKALVVNDNEAVLFDTYWGAVADPSTTTLANAKWARFPTQWSSSVMYSSTCDTKITCAAEIFTSDTTTADLVGYSTVPNMGST